MLHLEHLNLVVEDIPTTLNFYRSAFPHWSVRGSGEGTWHGKTRNWVHFGDDYQYLTFNDDGIGKNRDLTGHQVGLAHFAFVTDNIDAVIARLARTGFLVDKDGTVDDFRRNVYYLDPNGYEVEFVQYLSDIPPQRNQYD
ncbi:MAG: VOC family protein [Shewanella sp.]